MCRTLATPHSHLLLFDVCHIEVRLAVEFAGLKLLALLYVHTATASCLGFHKVTCCLTAYPSCRHIRDFRGWHQAIHILIEIDACFVTVNGHAFLQLHHLAEDVRGQPLQGFLASCRTAHHIAYGGDDFCIPTLP